MLYFASDHRGFALKEKIKIYLQGKDVPFDDLGAFAYQQDDDYLDYANALAHKILESKGNSGVALCGSGAGMSIALNRYKGIFAGLALSPEMAQAQKEQDDINILVIPANFVVEEIAKQMIDAFLHAKLIPEERYIRRIKKIENFSLF